MAPPALPADVPLLDGWNVWDVLQAQAPIDPLPGTPNDQLAAWVRDAVGVPDLPIALTTSAAAGERVTSRAQIPELAGTPALGVQGSGIVRRTIAFQSPGGASIPWPHDDNLLLDAVYDAAPAPASSGNTARPVVEQASLMPIALFAIGGLAIALMKGRRS